MHSPKYTRMCGIKVAETPFTTLRNTRFVWFGRQFVVGRKSYVVCECRCGSVIVTWSGALKNGNTQSCGCRRLDRITEVSTKHGSSHTSEYKTWTHIKQRCLNPNDHAYRNYGGRGITICDRWRDSVDAFLADMGKKPTPKHSIDRIDNNLGYSPGNCRWATNTEQTNNQRSNVVISLYGMSMTASQWSRVSLVPASVIYYRISRGWSAKKAVFYMDDRMSQRIASQNRKGDCV